jgi:transposase InsO family protein
MAGHHARMYRYAERRRTARSGFDSRLIYIAFCDEKLTFCGFENSNDGRSFAEDYLDGPDASSDRLQATSGQFRWKTFGHRCNILNRQFDVLQADHAWVTDITYIRIMKDFAYLAVVLDLYSRRVVGWSMQNRQATTVVLQALHMVVWRRKPKTAC